MTTPPQDEDDSGFRFEDDIDKVLGSANPNPQRVGCPGREVLAALARRERPIGDPGYEHIVNCSPCYREFRSLQQASPVPNANRGWQRWRLWPVAAAATLLLGTGVWVVLLTQRGPRVLPPESTPEQAAPLAAQLDLRKYTVTRSEAPSSQPPPLDIPRGSLDLTVLLPVGSEPGVYEVQLLDANLRSRASATGRADIRNYATTLRAALDLGQLKPGSYQFAVRREGEEWHMFPVVVK